MDGNDKGNSVILLRKNSAKMTVPRMTMHKIRINVRCVEVGASPHSAENRAQWLWAGKIALVELKTDDLEVAFFKTLIAKATHFHLHHFRQFARKITYMHTRAAVDVRRILVCEEKDFHGPPIE